MSVTVDLAGRVSNLQLAPRNRLSPLYEAISNSIHAIKDSPETETGRIDVYIDRDTTQRSVDGSPLANQPVTGFRIRDNGVGFTTDNFDAFQSCDTTHKRDIGGKGVGRLLWLKAFDHAEIESTYSEGDKTFLRRFDFHVSADGIEDSTLAEVEPADNYTEVRLVDTRPRYKQGIRYDTVANGIIKHFLEQMIAGECPAIFLHDEYEGISRNLNEQFSTELRVREKRKRFELRGKSFNITHVLLDASISGSHQLHFCAHDRSVRAEDTSALIPNLFGALHDSDRAKDVYYAGYVSGELLDEYVNADRNSFAIADEGTLIESEDEPTWQELVKSASKHATRFLDDYTAPIREAKRERIDEYVTKNPRFRHVVSQRSEWLDEIPAGCSDDQLDIHLYRLSQRLDMELRVEGERLHRRATRVAGDGIDRHRARMQKFLDDSNASQMAKLSEYVVHRRATLDFLEECLALQENGKHEYEDVLHDTIFPMKSVSGEVPEEQVNLWVIDERLAFHYFLASDKRFKNVGPIEVAEEHRRKRSDILVFQQYENRYDNPTAFVDSEPFDSVTVVEFKRPERDDYKDGDNPISQVDRYIRLIKQGEARDRNGTTINVAPTTPFFSFIVCTITPSLKEQAELNDYRLSPDGQGYVRYHGTLQAYQEIIDYRKLLSDAKKRNRIFFDKLGLPRRTPLPRMQRTKAE